MKGGSEPCRDLWGEPSRLSDPSDKSQSGAGLVCVSVNFYYHVTNYHKLSGLRQHPFSSQFYKSQVRLPVPYIMD